MAAEFTIVTATPHDASALAMVVSQLGKPTDEEGFPGACNRISVSSNDHRTDAHAFYPACGLPHSGKRFSASLDELD